jgi:hypothetical protein
MNAPIAARLFAVAAGLAVLAASPPPASAGPVAEEAAQAESLLGEGKAKEALEAFDRAEAAFWAAVPLELRTALFVSGAAGFGSYTPRAEGAFRAGETATIYIEPVGFAYAPEGDGFKAALAADISIRTPGGLILAKAADAARLEWTGHSKAREVQGTIRFALPALKPGSYDLVLGIRDLGSDKSAEATLALTIAE